MVKSLTYKQLVFLSFIFIFLFSCEKSITSSENKRNIKTTSEHSPILIFVKNEESSHKPSEVEIESIKSAAKSINLASVVSEKPSIFNDQQLQNFSSIIFLNTTGNILNNQQQLALERYIQAGGGFVGIHAAIDTEPNWHWYGRMIGGRSKGHLNIERARVKVVSNHSIVDGIPKAFEFEDEWLNFESLSDKRHNLILLDETSDKDKVSDSIQPIAWFQEFDGGRVFYTSLGHKKETYNNPIFIKQLTQGLKYTVGKGQLNYNKSRPLPNRFSKKTMVSGIFDPVSFDLTKNNTKALLANRKGEVYWLNLTTKNKVLAGIIPIITNTSYGWGMQAVVLDPYFDANNYAYFMFNIKDKKNGNQLFQRVSRFTFNHSGNIDLTSEVVMMNIPNDACCHTTGNMKFDEQGHLYITTGDNAENHINSHLGYSINTQDLRGKILRVIPENNGDYIIPPGNLFENVTQGKPEIYAIGVNNPSTLAYDNVEETLYFADIGPEYLSFPLVNKVKGFDEINKVKRAGHYGWPLFNGFDDNYNVLDQNKYGSWLPPAEEPLIAYSSQLNHLPELGSGSRNALVAGVYRSPLIFSESINTYPSYYDGSLFISDTMREWIKVVSFDSSDSIIKIENFAPNIKLSSPVSFKFSEAGELFVLESGANKNEGGLGGSLSKIEYIGKENRPPTAQIMINSLKGKKPFNLIANASTSSDPDNDELTYHWQITEIQHNTKLSNFRIDEKRKIYSGSDLKNTLSDNGTYALVLAVTDANNSTAYTHKVIEVGNAPPVIDITLDKNQSFIWADGADYQIDISDVEDGTLNNGVDLSDVNVSLKSIDKDDLPNINKSDLAVVGFINPQKNTIKYELSVDYTDKGLPGFSPIKVTKMIQLFPSKLLLANLLKEEYFDTDNIDNSDVVTVNLSGHESSIAIGVFDLSSVDSLKLVQYFSQNLNKNAIVEIRIGSPKGKVIAEGKFTDYTRLKPLAENEIQKLTLDLIKPINKPVNLFIVVNEADMPDSPAFRLSTIEFIRK